MTYCISLVTMNRRDILTRVLDAIDRTTQREKPLVLVSDNGSVDGTPAMLRERDKAGLLRAWLLPENLGAAAARNAHWAECIGNDTVKLDDKVLPLATGWLTSLKILSDAHHAVVGWPYCDTTLFLHTIAPCMPFVQWEIDSGIGGSMFIPAEATKALGAWDELPGCLYGWDDVLYIQRARLLGWPYGFSLRMPVEILARASEAARAKAQEHHAAYEQRLREYREAERDVCITLEDTAGWRAGQAVRT